MTLLIALSLSERAQRGRWDPVCFPSCSLDSLPDSPAGFFSTQSGTFSRETHHIWIFLTFGGIIQFLLELDNQHYSLSLPWLLASREQDVHEAKGVYCWTVMEGNRRPVVDLWDWKTDSSEGSNPLSPLRQTRKQKGSWTSCLLLEMMAPEH